MRRKFSLAIEGEPGSYSAYVPELPTILVTGQSLDELTDRAVEAIRLHWETVRADLSPTAMLPRDRGRTANVGRAESCH